MTTMPLATNRPDASLNRRTGAAPVTCGRVLALLLCLCALLPGVLWADDGWRAVAHPAHLGRVDAAAKRVETALAGVPADAYGVQEIPALRTLLARPVVALEAEQLTGSWRCRSIQVSTLGVFSYPPFRCEIELTEDGTLAFTKRSGSQRRHGQLYPDAATRWVLLGGSSVNDEPYRSYSGSLGDADGEDLEFDTVGLLEAIDRKHLRLLLDAEADQFEVYELTR